MKISTPKPACFYASGHEEAAQVVLYLHAEGHAAWADENPRPRITVPGIAQADLNELVWSFCRRVAETERAREVQSR